MLQERNIVLEDTEEGYAAQLGDSVRQTTSCSLLSEVYAVYLRDCWDFRCVDG